MCSPEKTMKIKPVTISPKAYKEIADIISKKKVPQGYGLRVGIRGAGCAGVSYMLGFDKKKEGDIEYSVNDLAVYIEKKHAMYLVGLQIDFYEGADARGFTFVNAELPVPDKAD